MRLLFCSSRNCSAVTEKFRFLTFTVKLIMPRIIWLILAILSLTGCIYLTHHTGPCPTSYIMIL
ncbi:hypothetical protein LINGRAPRIM_LOCUS2659 [Linum grandiflorum]